MDENCRKTVFQHAICAFVPQALHRCCEYGRLSQKQTTKLRGQQTVELQDEKEMTHKEDTR